MLKYPAVHMLITPWIWLWSIYCFSAIDFHGFCRGLTLILAWAYCVFVMELHGFGLGITWFWFGIIVFAKISNKCEEHFGVLLTTYLHTTYYLPTELLTTYLLPTYYLPNTYPLPTELYSRSPGLSLLGALKGVPFVGYKIHLFVKELHNKTVVFGLPSSTGIEKSVRRQEKGLHGFGHGLTWFLQCTYVVLAMELYGFCN